MSQQEQQRLAAIARESAPVIWLLGKSGAGKTSVIAALTGAGHDQIGNGYQPCTRTSQLYDFPAETPLIRFLDTRGLDEASYDPSEDLAWHQSQAQLIMVVMRLD
ncbi:MAG: GTPase domain-containing protein, partial [Porticoccaceae bacterium]|nr:GTPase domain-containing protein [Porticoccaceae bacterium]